MVITISYYFHLFPTSPAYLNLHFEGLIKDSQWIWILFLHWHGTLPFDFLPRLRFQASWAWLWLAQWNPQLQKRAVGWSCVPVGYPILVSYFNGHSNRYGDTSFVAVAIEFIWEYDMIWYPIIERLIIVVSYFFIHIFPHFTAVWGVSYASLGGSCDAASHGSLVVSSDLPPKCTGGGCHFFGPGDVTKKHGLNPPNPHFHGENDDNIMMIKPHKTMGYPLVN